jgi:hypothetical protein
MFTDVSEVLTTSIIRTIAYYHSLIPVLIVEAR